MQQNKTGKYLKYAIGEIVLVVIGILIALSINNWNENRKEREEEFNILNALKVDLNESKERLAKTMKKQKKVINNNILLLEILNNKVEVNIHLDSIGEIFDSGLLTFFRAEPVTGTYDAMIGAGKTALIQNEDLNRLLAEYSTEIKMGFEDYEYGMILMQLVLDKTANYNSPFFTKKRNNQHITKELKNSVKKLLNDRALDGIAAKKNGVERRRFQRQEDLLQYVEEILTIINQELEND